MKISFHGAIESVTGSCHLIEFNNKKILLDCGQFQGSRKEDEMNFEEFLFNPGEIDYLLLSHSHIDHCGRIPLLVKRGFKGKIVCTKPTFDLCQIMLMDSAFIHESEAEWQSRKAKRAGRKPVEPLYTQADASNSFSFFNPCLYDQIIDLDKDLSVRFVDAGHILGSSIVEIWIDDEKTGKNKIVFSGDLGTESKPILNDPTPVNEADYILIESTYGNRLHEEVEVKTKKLVDIILNTARRGGNIVIPSFAVGRTQELIYDLNKYYDGNEECTEEIRKIPVYIDSPLAINATDVFKINSQVFDEETKNYIFEGDNPLNFYNLHFVKTAEESKKLNEDMTPKIIISASGMCEAGRIKHHLKHNLWRKESSIVFVGYQAENTLGRKIKDGEKIVKIFGEEISVQAEIHDIDGFSGHADRNGLLSWLKNYTVKPKKVFIVHGEEESKQEFYKYVTNEVGFKAVIPRIRQIYELGLEEDVVGQIGDGQIGDKLAKADKEQVKRLLEKMANVKNMVGDSINLTVDSVIDDINVDDFNKISNRIIELEDAIMNLTMESGK